jgi:hypothetical protein
MPSVTPSSDLSRGAIGCAPTRLIPTGLSTVIPAMFAF